MSASLVGSEMCIRDSGSLVTWVARSRSQASPSQLGRKEDASSEMSPVSYTHLTLPTICSV
eukprot:4359435-Alexandrium_andersonii.AAC.1